MAVVYWYYNYDQEEITLRNLIPIGKPGLLISGAPIDDLPYFKDDLKRAIKEVNPNLENIASFSVHHKSNKVGKITLSTEGKAQEDQYFYIVQALKKIDQKT